MKTIKTSGYAYCACAGCFELVVTSRPGKALCFACKDAGCEVCGTTECAAQDMDFYMATDENEEVEA